MQYKGVTGSGIFMFDDQGNFLSFRAHRYMGADENAQQKEWIITVNESMLMNNIKVPIKLDVTWKLESGDWTWLKLEITNLEYNVAERY